jgi:hypothetical protein
MAEPIFTKLDIYIIATESTDPSHQSVCLARHRLGKNVIDATRTYAKVEKLFERSSIRSVSQRGKVGDQLFPELLVRTQILNLNVIYLY